MTTALETLSPAGRSALIAARKLHWQRARRITFTLLAVWFGATFCTVFFARELSTLTVFGWPLSFYLAAQGASLVYLAIIGFYAWRMRRLDQQARAAAKVRP